MVSSSEGLCASESASAACWTDPTAAGGAAGGADKINFPYHSSSLLSFSVVSLSVSKGKHVESEDSPP